MENRKQIFSIRKLTVGTASVLIASLAIGLGQNNNFVNEKIQEHISYAAVDQPNVYKLYFGASFDHSPAIIFYGNNLSKIEAYDFDNYLLGSMSSRGNMIDPSRSIRPGEEIRIVPYDIYGNKGNPIYIYNTDRTKLETIYDQYRLADVENTSRYKNSSLIKRKAYDQAWNKITTYEYNARPTQAEVDQAVNNFDQAFKALDGKGTDQPNVYKLYFGGQFDHNPAIIFYGNNLSKIEAYDLDNHLLGSMSSRGNMIDPSRKINPGEEIVIVPYDLYGNKGTPIHCFNTDRTKLSKIYDQYRLADVESTSRYRNSSLAKRKAYDEAWKKIADYEYNARPTQAEVDQAVNNFNQAFKALDGKGTNQPDVYKVYFGGSFDHNPGIIFYGNNLSKIEAYDLDNHLLGSMSSRGNMIDPSRSIKPGEEIKLIPYDIYGNEGNAIYVYNTDRTKLNIIYDQYRLADVESTSRYQKSSLAKRKAYDQAWKKIESYEYNARSTQEEVDQAVNNFNQAFKALDGEGEPIEPVKPSVPSTPSSDEPSAPFIPEVPNIPNNSGHSSNNSQEELLSTVLYAPVINGNRNWKIALRDSNGKLTGKYISTGTSWKIFGRKMINGVLFYRLGSQQQWVPAEYLNGNSSNDSSAAETKLSTTGYVARLANHPNWRIALYNSQGHLTSYLRPNSNWKVLGSKRINGRLMYRLGTEDQWIPAQYIRVR